MNKPPRKPQKRTRVLVVLSSNGFVELFADKDVDFHVAQRLHVDTIEAERLAEDLLDITIPKSFRNLFFPGKLRATALVEKITAETALDTLYKLSILRGLREMQNEQSAEKIPAAIKRARRTAR